MLTLASIVEREAAVDEERPLIAGVYQNRLNPKKWPTGLLQSDPTIFYVNDTLKLDEMKFDALAEVRVLGRAQGAAARTTLPDDARRLQHVHEQGPAARADLVARRSPRSTPRSRPDTKTGYLFFIAKGDGTGTQRLREDARRARQERREVRQGLT